MEPELNPCPVCGGEAELGCDAGLCYIYCYDCGRCTDVYYLPENAVYAWNMGIVDIVETQDDG